MSRKSIRYYLVLAASAATLLPSTALAEECSNADFQGRYAIQSANTIIGGAQGNWAAGTLYADGTGTITEWKDTFVFSAVNPEGAEQKIVRERDLVGTAVGPVTYEVSPDCRITVRLTSAARPPSDPDVEFRGGLAFGGKEVLATAVLPNSAKAGMIMKSIDPPADDELEAISAKLVKILRRLGFHVPRDSNND